jgi:hypothetical protein
MWKSCETWFIYIITVLHAQARAAHSGNMKTEHEAEQGKSPLPLFTKEG